MKALLLGDLSPTIKTNQLFAKKETEKLFTDTVSVFQGNDINFVNLECALTDSENAIEKFGPPLKAVFEVADVLAELGVNCCGLSNNHFFDFGKQGVKDTFEALSRAGILYTGFGNNYEDSRKNIVFEKDGEKVAIIAVCEHEYSYALEDRMGSRPYDEYHTIEDIAKAKKENDRVIVIYHGGKELCRYPSPRLHKACHAMVRSGADVVLCQHSHCIGCYESYEGGHILYGQGNFHFVKPDFGVTDEMWNTSLAVKYDTETNEIEFIPFITCDDTDGISVAKGEDKERILAGFEKRNKELQNGEWKAGWHAFCESVKDRYLNVINEGYTESSTERQNARFAHFLDCEAHTDVWRELCPTYNMTNEK
ncbi:MAG: CapA family protein [Clostridia bacterium]|nr:CapA family protein [Clostridia bacterium]